MSPAAPAGDSDLDSIPNLLEYALNLQPGQSDVHFLPQPVLSSTTLTYSWQKLLSRPDVALVAQMSTDLITWTNLP